MANINLRLKRKEVCRDSATTVDLSDAHHSDAKSTETDSEMADMQQDNDRVLWKTYAADEVANVLHAEMGRKLASSMGLVKALGISYSAPAIPAVIDFVLRFDSDKNAVTINGRTIHLTVEMLREAFQLPSRYTYAEFKQTWPSKAGEYMFKQKPGGQNPYSMTNLIAFFESWKPILRLVQELLMGKHKPTQLQTKDLWFIHAHCWPYMPDHLKKCEPAKPNGCPDWAELMRVHLRREIQSLKSHILKVRANGGQVKNYISYLGVAITRILEHCNVLDGVVRHVEQDVIEQNNEEITLDTASEDKGCTPDTVLEGKGCTPDAALGDEGPIEGTINNMSIKEVDDGALNSGDACGGLGTGEYVERMDTEHMVVAAGQSVENGERNLARTGVLHAATESDDDVQQNQQMANHVSGRKRLLEGASDTCGSMGVAEKSSKSAATSGLVEINYRVEQGARRQHSEHAEYPPMQKKQKVNIEAQSQGATKVGVIAHKSSWNSFQHVRSLLDKDKAWSGKIEKELKEKNIFLEELASKLKEKERIHAIQAHAWEKKEREYKRQLLDWERKEKGWKLREQDVLQTMQSLEEQQDMLVQELDAHFQSRWQVGEYASGSHSNLIDNVEQVSFQLSLDGENSAQGEPAVDATPQHIHIPVAERSTTGKSSSPATRAMECEQRRPGEVTQTDFEDIETNAAGFFNQPVAIEGSEILLNASIKKKDPVVINENMEAKNDFTAGDAMTCVVVKSPSQDNVVRDAVEEATGLVAQPPPDENINTDAGRESYGLLVEPPSDDDRINGDASEDITEPLLQASAKKNISLHPRIGTNDSIAEEMSAARDGIDGVNTSHLVNKSADESRARGSASDSLVVENNEEVSHCVVGNTIGVANESFVQVCSNTLGSSSEKKDTSETIRNVIPYRTQRRRLLMQQSSDSDVVELGGDSDSDSGEQNDNRRECPSNMTSGSACPDLDFETSEYLEKIMTKTCLDDSELIKNADYPAGIKRDKGFVEYKHQKVAIAWMEHRETGKILPCGGGLLDDAGLGKTLMVISLCLINRASRGSPTLIVCPSGVLTQWMNEFTKFVREDQRFSMLKYHGQEKKTWKAEDVMNYEVVFTTYDTLKARVDKSKKTDANRSQPVLQQIDWHRVVLDECQYIKNESSDRFKAANDLLSYSRWILSATPVQNKVGEMHPYFAFLKYPPLEPMPMFEEAVQEAREQGYRRSSLERSWNNMCLRRTKDILKNALPKPVEEVIEVDFRDTEAASYQKLFSRNCDIYREYKEKKVSRLIVTASQMRVRQETVHPQLYLLPNLSKKVPRHRERAALLSILGKLAEAQCCSCKEYVNKETAEICLCFHFACQPCAITGFQTCYQCEREGRKQKCGSDIPTYNQKVLEATSQGQLERERRDLLQTLEPSSKITAVLRKLKTIRRGKEKAIVFSQWTSALDMLEHFCMKWGMNSARVDGSMAQDARDSSLAHFGDDSETGVLLLSLHAANVGLNITCANHVLFLDAWWNPTAEEQGVGRAHRLGQRKIVKVYRFINRATIETRIYDLQQAKKKMVDVVMANGKTTGNETLNDSSEARAWDDIFTRGTSVNTTG